MPNQGYILFSSPKWRPGSRLTWLELISAFRVASYQEGGEYVYRHFIMCYPYGVWITLNVRFKALEAASQIYGALISLVVRFEAFEVAPRLYGALIALIVCLEIFWAAPRLYGALNALVVCFESFEEAPRLYGGFNFFGLTLLRIYDGSPKIFAPRFRFLWWCMMGICDSTLVPLLPYFDCFSSLFRIGKTSHYFSLELSPSILILAR